MKKILLTMILMISLLLSACSADPQQAASGNAYSFTDDLGRSVTVTAPQRTAALLGSFAQIWQLAGGQVCATANDAWDDLQLELPEETIDLGGKESLSLELLLAAEPDFVLASTNTPLHREWQDTLEKAGIPVAFFDVSDFDDYLRLLQICTGITGRADLYEQHGTAVQAQIDRVVAESQNRVAEKGAPKVLSLTAAASFVKAKNSEGNVLGTMLKQLGCSNIADSETMLLEDLSVEQILLSDPDYIFIVQRGDNETGMREYVSEHLLSHPAWSQLTAVKNGKVFFMEKALYSLKPNHRWGEAYEKLEEILANE